MKLEPTKQSKRLRVALCVFFLIHIYLCSIPFVLIYNEETNESLSYTVIDLLLMFRIGNAAELARLSMLSAIFIIIPAAGFFFAAFDKQRGLKFGVGIACSILGATVVTILIGPAMLSIGSLLALLLYIITLFLSVLGLFSRNLPG